MGTGRMPFGGVSSNNNSTSSRFGFGGGGSGRNQSSAFDFGGNTSSKFYSRNDEGTSPNSMTENSFSSRRTQFDNDQTREIGSVKRWTNDRGFGFIRRANGGPDLFCHVRSLKGGIQSLDEVNFHLFKSQNYEI
jgi:cold shock CspA family protein